LRLLSLAFKSYQKISFVLGAGFIYLLLSLSPAIAEETAPLPSETQPATTTVSPSPQPSTTTSTSTEPAPTPSPTPTAEPTTSPEPSPSPSPEASPTSSPEPSPEPTPTQTPQPTPEPSPTPSPTTTTETTPTPEPTPTVTSEQSAVVTPTTPPPVVVETVTPGGDDTSYRIPLTTSVLFNGVEYTDVYATTNSVIAFGRQDNTYWTYPSTPSISIESKDWWALPNQMPDTHFIIRTSDGGFQVDGKYRPYGSMSGATTQIVITAQILTDGNVSYTYSVDGPLAGFSFFALPLLSKRPAAIAFAILPGLSGFSEAMPFTALLEKEPSFLFIL